MSTTRTLAAEAVRDASRRRIVAAILVLSLGSLVLVDGCTSCAGSEITINGQAQTFTELAGATGTLLFVLLGLWVVALAGILGSDHLQQTLEDGSAQLCLARPLSRDQFAVARLAGALSIAWLAGLILLGVAAVLLHLRSGLAPLPALAAGGACALGALTCAALGMSLSLVLPRLASLLIILGSVVVISFANVVSLAAPGPGVLGWIDRLAPPFASAMWIPLDPWIESVSLTGDPEGTGYVLWVWLRAILWAAGSVGILVWTFRRLEIRS